jgi:hypothetical protein
MRKTRIAYREGYWNMSRQTAGHGFSLTWVLNLTRATEATENRLESSAPCPEDVRQCCQKPYYSFLLRAVPFSSYQIMKACNGRGGKD